MKEDYLKPHILAGTSVFMDAFTTIDSDFKLEFIIQSPGNIPRELTASQRKTISDLLSEIPGVRCEIVNGNYSILTERDKTYRLFSHFSDTFRESRINAPDDSNRKLPEYEKAKILLAKLGYPVTEFDSQLVLLR